MTENVAILLAVLVAANVLLLLVVVARAWIQRRRSSRRAALDAIASTPVARPSSGPRPSVTTGMATADPAADNTTAAGRAQNRRVSVNVLVSKALDGQ